MHKRRSLTWIQIGAAAAIFALAGAASAIPLTIVQEAAGTVGPQSTSNPCVIAATTCQQPAGLTYTNYTQSGAITSYNELSPLYTAGELAGFGLTTFNIAIDVNTASGQENLQLFEVLIGGAPAYTFTGPYLIGSVSSNVNGYADWTLRTADLSGVAAGTSVQFHAVWNNASDGGESFFLVSTPTRLPEPGTAGLLGLILGGLALASRKRLRR